MSEKLKRIIKRHIILIAVVCLFVFISSLTGIGCPINYILKIPCPACGTTRAMLSLLRLDLKAYLGYNFMALPLCVAVLLMFNIDIIKHKQIATGFAIAVAAVTFVRWIVRLTVIF